MLNEQTHQKLNAMKLYGMAHSIRERLERRDHQDLSKAEFVSLVVDDEWLYRENRKLSARLKVARFKQRSASLENINYATPRGLRKDQILELAQNRWITTHQTLLIVGPSGSGKSFLAQAFGSTRLSQWLLRAIPASAGAAVAVRPGPCSGNLRSPTQASLETLRAHHR